jgi:nucleoside-diphosphate-sugar epimerase
LKNFATGLSGDIGRNIKAGDIANFEARIENSKEVGIRMRFLKPKGFLHLAGIVGNSAVNADLENSYNINVTSTRNLGKIALESGVSRFLYVSSGHVYGNTELPAREDGPTNPISSYAEQKLMAESSLLEIFSGEPEKLTIVRVFSVLGFGMKANTLGGAVERNLNSHSITCIQNSQDIRDFLTPYQVANCLVKLLNYNGDLPKVINLASGVPMTIQEGVQHLLDSKKITLSSNIFLPGFSAMPKNYASIENLKKLFP